MRACLIGPYLRSYYGPSKCRTRSIFCPALDSRVDTTTDSQWEGRQEASWTGHVAILLAGGCRLSLYAWIHMYVNIHMYIVDVRSPCLGIIKPYVHMHTCSALDAQQTRQDAVRENVRVVGALACMVQGRQDEQ